MFTKGAANRVARRDISKRLLHKVSQVNETQQGSGGITQDKVQEGTTATGEPIYTYVLTDNFTGRVYTWTMPVDPDTGEYNKVMDYITIHTPTTEEHGAPCNYIDGGMCDSYDENRMPLYGKDEAGIYAGLAALNKRHAQKDEFDENSIKEKHRDDYDRSDTSDDERYPKHNNITKLNPRYRNVFNLILDSPSYDSKLIDGTIEAHIDCTDIEKCVIDIFDRAGFFAESDGSDIDNNGNYELTIKVGDDLFENVIHNGSFEETDGKVNIILEHNK